MNTEPSSAIPREAMTPSGIRPLRFWKAVLFFALPSLAFRVSIYNGMPRMTEAGLSPYEAFVVAFVVPSAILFALALGFAQLDSVAMTWAAIRERFRLFRMTRRDWVWTLGGFLLAFLAGGMLTVATQQLIEVLPAIAPPDFFPPMLDPRVGLSTDSFAEFVGAPLPGNWGVFVLYAITLSFNILGEELWWRGYILPRQELVHGSRTWLVHGLMWMLFHVSFYPWAVVSLLPVCLVIAYVSQRRQNNTPAIVIHGLYNGAPLVLTLALVLGLM